MLNEIIQELEADAEKMSAVWNYKVAITRAIDIIKKNEGKFKSDIIEAFDKGWMSTDELPRTTFGIDYYNQKYSTPSKTNETECTVCCGGGKIEIDDFGNEVDCTWCNGKGVINKKL